MSGKQASEQDSVPVHGTTVDAEALRQHPHTSRPIDQPPDQPTNSTIICDVESYETKSSGKPGKVIFFNHKEFVDKSIPTRREADDEERLITETFEKMGFQVDVVKKNEDLENTKIEDRLKTAFKEDNYADYDSLFVIICTYGIEEGSKLRANDSSYLFEEKLHELMNGQGDSLAGLPKVFIIQAYAPETAKGEPHKPGAHDKGAEEAPLIPVFADMFIAYASKPGFTPPKINKSPTSFIKILCETINEQVINKPAAERQHDDLETIVGIARSKIAKNDEDEKNEDDEVPISVTTLTKQFKFPSQTWLIHEK